MQPIHHSHGKFPLSAGKSLVSVLFIHKYLGRVLVRRQGLVFNLS